MMKYIIFSLLVTAVPHGNHVLGQTMPTFHEVIRSYFTHYKFDDGGKPLSVSFQKKRDGWYTSDVGPYWDYYRPQLFWSAATKKYLPLQYYSARVASDNTVETDIGQYISLAENNPASLYDDNIYYGYMGWEVDVIQEFADKASLTDRQLNGLAQAYIKHAASFFRATLDVPVPGPGVSEKNNFIMFMEKALKAYEMLYKTAPAYHYVYAWHTLRMAGYPAEATKFLKPGIYPENLLIKARSFLRDASKNAILVTQGDRTMFPPWVTVAINDTYPIWYVQQTENYRTDVTVVDYNLLGARLYILDLSQSKEPLISTPSRYFLEKDFDLAQCSSSDLCRQPIALHSLLHHLNSPDAYKELAPGQRYRMYSCRNVDVVYTPENAYSPGKQGKIELILEDVLVPEDFMLLDMLDTNLRTRPLNFTSPSISPIFANKLKPAGTVYKISMNQ